MRSGGAAGTAMNAVPVAKNPVALVAFQGTNRNTLDRFENCAAPQRARGGTARSDARAQVGSDAPLSSSVILRAAKNPLSLKEPAVSAHWIHCCAQNGRPLNTRRSGKKPAGVVRAGKCPVLDVLERHGRLVGDDSPYLFRTEISESLRPMKRAAKHSTRPDSYDQPSTRTA